MRLPERNETAMRALRGAVVGSAYAGVSYLVLRCFLGAWSASLRTELPYALNLSGNRPYVYRVLSPLLVRGVMALLGAAPPSETGGAVTPSSVAFVASEWLMFGALLGTTLVWRSLVLSAFPSRRGLADVVPALALLALPATFVGGGFLYDFPDLLLASACYLALLRRRWAAWYVLLVLLVLNKEASVLAVAWWVSLRGELPPRAWWTHAALSAALGGAVVLALWWALRDRPGYMAQPNGLHNLRYWASFRWLLASRDTLSIGVRLPVAFHAINVAILVWTFVVGRPRVPREVTRAFVGSVLAVAPLFLSFGFENEIRVFAVATPPLVVLAAGALGSLVQSRST